MASRRALGMRPTGYSTRLGNRGPCLMGQVYTKGNQSGWQNRAKLCVNYAAAGCLALSFAFSFAVSLAIRSEEMIRNCSICA